MQNPPISCTSSITDRCILLLKKLGKCLNITLTSAFVLKGVLEIDTFIAQTYCLNLLSTATYSRSSMRCLLELVLSMHGTVRARAITAYQKEMRFTRFKKKKRVRLINQVASQ